MITNLGKKFKGYYLDKNYGYGTKQHLKAIKNLGITNQHRKTFSPINKLKQVSRRNTRSSDTEKLIHKLNLNNSILG